MFGLQHLHLSYQASCVNRLAEAINVGENKKEATLDLGNQTGLKSVNKANA